MKETVRLALVGCGGHMYNLMYDYLKNSPIELAAVCDLDEAKLARFTAKYTVGSTYTDYRKMLAEVKPDAVFCITDAQTHYEVARDSMLAGAHVYIEKTPSVTAAQAAELSAIQRRTGLIGMTGFNRRFSTAYMMAKEIIDRPEFAPVTMYLAKYNSSPYRSEEYFLLNHIIHHLDVARYFLGEIADLHVRRVRVSDTLVGFHVSFATENGAIGMLQSGSLQYEQTPMERIEITGVGRSVIIDNVMRLEYNRPAARKDGLYGPKLEDGGDTLVWNLNHGLMTNNTHYGFDRGLLTFIDCVRQGKPGSPDFEDSARTMALYEQLLAAVKESC